MISIDKIIKGFGIVLIIISVTLIFIDIKFFGSYWNELAIEPHLIRLKKDLQFDVFRYTVLCIGGIGLLFKNTLGWVFSQAFLFLSFYLFLNNLILDFEIRTFNIDYIIANIIFLILIIAMFLFLNKIVVKNYLDLNSYKTRWLWLSVFVIVIIGIVIHKI